MNYYKIIAALSEYEDYWDLNEILNYDEYLIKKIKNQNFDEKIIDKPIKIEIDEDFGTKELDWNITISGVIIVSEKVKNLFTEEEAKFYPVKIVNYQPITNYYAIRINSFYDCVDEASSEFKYWSENEINLVPSRKNKYSSLNRFLINDTNVGKSNIFRLSKYETTIIITEVLKNNFEKNEITGLSFLKIEGSR